MLAQNIVVGAFVVLLMLSVGLDLSVDSVLGTIRQPLSLGAGVLTGYILVPLLALTVAALAEVGAGVRAGLLLCAFAPGGPMGAYLTWLARGNVPLAATMVLFFNAANTVLIPVGLSLAGVAGVGGGFEHLGEMATTILLYQILPLVAGMAFRRVAPGRAAKLQRLFASLANLLLVLVGGGVVLFQGGRFLEAGPRAVLAVLSCVLGSLLIGWFCSPRRRADRVALACVGVIHSTSACILLATTWFKDPLVLLTVVLWSGTMFVVGVVAARLMRRGSAEAGPAGA